MGNLIRVFTIVGMMLMLGGCGKTLSELRADGNAILDNGSTLGKKVIDAAVAVYELGKKVVEDIKDNVSTVKDAVPGDAAKK